MATAVRVRFPPSAPARHQGLWQVAATLSFFVVSSSAASPACPLFFLPLRIWVKQVVQKVPQMPSAAASSAHPHSAFHSHPTPRRSGQHLLCVGRIFYFRCALPAAAKKRLGNAEIRLSLGTCFRQEAKLLACQLFALLHASLPGVPDLPTLRHILIRHLSSMQGKKGREYGRLPRPSSSLPSWQMKDKKKSLPALFGTKHSPILGSDEFEEYPQRDKLPPGCDHIGNIQPQ